MRVKVFTQQACPKCPAAKELAKKLEDTFTVEYHDIKTENGLAEALEYDIMSTPSMVVVDSQNNIMQSWVSNVPQLEDFNKFRK